LEGALIDAANVQTASSEADADAEPEASAEPVTDKEYATAPKTGTNFDDAAAAEAEQAPSEVENATTNAESVDD
jgi:hypothetical protein